MFTFPTAATVVASSTEYASSLFTAFTPIMWIPIGVAAAVVAILFVIRHVRSGIKGATGMRGRRRGRRR